MSGRAAAPRAACFADPPRCRQLRHAPVVSQLRPPMKTLPSCFAIRPGGCTHTPPDGPVRPRAERAAHAGRLRCSLPPASLRACRMRVTRWGQKVRVAGGWPQAAAARAAVVPLPRRPPGPKAGCRCGRRRAAQRAPIGHRNLNWPRARRRRRASLRSSDVLSSAGAAPAAPPPYAS